MLANSFTNSCLLPSCLHAYSHSAQNLVSHLVIWICENLTKTCCGASPVSLAWFNKLARGIECINYIVNNVPYRNEHLHSTLSTVSKIRQTSLRAKLKIIRAFIY